MNNNFLKYANSFQTVSKLGLEAPAMLLDFLGNPQKSLKFIHVAGTNGKGSVCCFLQSILTKAGYKTGKFTSPDMLSVCERISIDGNLISNDEMNCLLEKVSYAAEKVNQKLGTMPTQFEIWTAAAFCYFKDNNCDIVVLEVGLGGRLDATNVIDSPLVSVITRIDYDHMNYLGNTLKDITHEKCGIIKQDSKTVTFRQQEEILEEINKECYEKNNTLYVSDIPESIVYDNKEKFDYKDIKNIFLSLRGKNQVENASLAIETAKILNIDNDDIIYGLANTTHIGRFEIISETPLTVYDGAHNRNGFKALLDNIDRYFNTKDVTFICAFMQDKDISEIFELLEDYKDTSKIIATTVLNNGRAEKEDVLYSKFNAKGFEVSCEKTVKDAYENAKFNNNLIVICGSLYLYKDLMS